MATCGGGLKWLIFPHEERRVATSVPLDSWRTCDVAETFCLVPEPDSYTATAVGAQRSSTETCCPAEGG